MPKLATTVSLSLLMLAAVWPAAASDPWGPPAVPLSPIFNYYSAIAAHGTTVHLSYGDEAVYYRRSLNEGATWSPEVFIGDGFNFLEDPLVVDGDNIYLLYVDNIRNLTDWLTSRPVGDIYMRVSRDGGDTWLPEQQLTTARGAFRVSLAASGGRLHLVWMDLRSTTTWDIYYLRGLSQPGGTVLWEPEQLKVAGTNSFGAERPQLAATGDVVHMAWMDARDDNPPCLIESTILLPQCSVVYYARSTDAGATWEPDQRMVAEDVYSGRPDIAADPNGTVLLPFDFAIDPSAGTTHVLRSNDFGATWPTPPKQISFPPGEAHHSFVRVDAKRAHYAWSEDEGPNEEILYRGSNDGGSYYGPEELVSASGKAAPLMAVSDNYAHIIWSSGTVMYRRRLLDAEPIPALTPEGIGGLVVAIAVVACGTGRRSARMQRRRSEAA